MKRLHFAVRTLLNLERMNNTKGYHLSLSVRCFNLCFESLMWKKKLKEEKAYKVRELQDIFENTQVFLMCDASKTSRETGARTQAKMEDESNPPRTSAGPQWKQKCVWSQPQGVLHCHAPCKGVRVCVCVCVCQCMRLVWDWSACDLVDAPSPKEAPSGRHH